MALTKPSISKVHCNQKYLRLFRKRDLKRKKRLGGGERERQAGSEREKERDGETDRALQTG